MSNRLSLIIRAMFVLLVFTFTRSSLAAPNNLIQPNAVFRAAEKTSWFEQGNPNAKHEIYIIAEPNCSACHYLYESIRPYIGSGSLKVRWIMVAFLKPSSLDKAATIISSKNPAQALEVDESKFNAAAESGGIVPAANIYAGAKDAVIKNTRFMEAYGFKSTPIIIFKLANGKTEILHGAPQQNKWPELLPYIRQSS